MKVKKLIIVAYLITASIAPAHAISEGYRKQLEQQGRTQQDDINSSYHAPEYKPGNMKPVQIRKFGVEFKRSRDGFAYIDGLAALPSESNQDATVYSQGIYKVTTYTNGHIILMKNDKSIGRMK